MDTFEEEEPIDLAAVVKEIRAIDKEMEGTDQLIREFCAELKIKAPV